ncbi:hypothetical protein CAP35_02295 [Chitinophagaceae bacterium IBVUCB1]|nr:hypothetical protein CAP35_02295 [Chitinophagaceae bacterium IBVUCB1]
MKPFSIFLMPILLIFFFACCTTVRAQTATNKIELGSFPVSVDAKMLMLDLQNELNASKQTLKNFVPSTRFVEKYNLQKIKGKYYISGFIQTNNAFSEKKLRKIKVHPGQPSGGIRTVMIPLSAFTSFLNQKGITYFELSKKLEVN